MADNLLDKASILLTPTAYNDGSMLSIKPENGDGDFTFSRSSAATRVNAQGLVENVQIISSELVSNGDFSQIGTEEVLNGNFSQEGSELVTNGDFATDSDWTLGTGWTISNGKLIGNNATGYALQGGVFASGVSKIYKITLTVSDYVSGYFTILTSGGTSQSQQFNANGDYTIYFNTNSPSGTTLHFTYFGSFTGSIDNVSVKEVGQDWSLGSGWSIGDGKALATSGSGSKLQQSISGLSGKTCKVSFTLSDYGGSGVALLDFGSTSGQSISANGTYTEIGTYDQNYFQIFKDSSFTGSITNISIKEVGQDWTLGTGWSVDQANSKATCDGTQTSTSTLQSARISNIQNDLIKLSFEIKDYSAGTVSVTLQGTGGIEFINLAANGVYEINVTSTDSLPRLLFNANSSFIGSITNISVKEITDDTDLPRINYSGFSYQDSLGSEQVVNGDFSNGSANWFNPDGAATFSNNSVTINGGSGNRRINQTNVTSPITSQFKLQYEITEKVGTSDLKIYTTNSGIGTYTIVPSTIGVHTFYFSSNLTTFYFNFNSTSGSITIDNVSVKEVTGQEVVPDSGCGNWLLEPQSTNLVTYSEDFSLWANGATYTTQNYSVSPSGEQNASRCLFTGADQNIQLSFSNSAETTASIYVKGVSGETIRFGTSFQENNFTLDGTWQRLSITRSVSPYSFAISISTYGGATARDIEIWGAQIENLSYATSYIPTNGAIATRLADVANNSGNSDLFNDSEGVLYVEISALDELDVTARYIQISDGTSTANGIQLRYYTLTNLFQALYYTNGAYQCVLSYTLPNSSEFNKMAFKYKQNDFALWVDGLEVGTDANGLTGANLSNLSFDYNGFSNFYGNIKCVAVYKEALTDAELQSLTTI